MTKPARTTIVSVSYNSAAVLPAMLASVPKNAALVVVDNCSTDDSIQIARNGGATVVALDSNQGFGRAGNEGASRADTEFLLFLNPDATMDTGCLPALEAAADSNPAISAINPQIRKPDGGFEFKRRSLLLPRSKTLPRELHKSDGEMHSLSGGALFCRTDCFRRVGGFDPAIFLYHEDDDLAARLAAECGPLWHCVSAKATHTGGHSSGRTPTVARLKGYFMARSRVYVLRKHGFVMPWLRTLGSVAGAAILPHNVFSTRRRAKHSGMLAGVWSSRRDGGAFDHAE
jgi:GT2 family glycosyltransferase